MEQKMMPFSISVSLNVVLTDTESITASTSMPLSAICSSRGMPSLLKVLMSSGSTSSNDLGASFFCAVGSA